MTAPTLTTLTADVESFAYRAGYGYGYGDGDGW